MLADEDAAVSRRPGTGRSHADPAQRLVRLPNAPQAPRRREHAPLLHFGAYRYTERLLGVGAAVCVMGELRSHSETGDVAAATAARLRSWKQDQRALLARFDTNHDGRLSGAEWDAARAAAARESQSETLTAPIARVSVIAQPVNGEPFLIAPLSAVALERRERLYAGLYFVVGLVSVVVCAWALRHAALAS